MLTRREYGPTSFIIRWATKSPFSHAALVFTTPDQEPGIGNTFVIEAGTGVDLTNLRDYATDEASFVAIKRLRQTWFDEKQSRVRGLLLDNIKSEYNYWAIVRIVRNIWFGLERSMRGKDKAVQQFDKREWKRPNEFICSGLVQFGFVEAVAEYVLQRKLPPWALNEVVFSETAAARLISKGVGEGRPVAHRPQHSGGAEGARQRPRGDHARRLGAERPPRMAVLHPEREGAQGRQLQRSEDARTLVRVAMTGGLALFPDGRYNSSVGSLRSGRYPMITLDDCIALAELAGTSARDRGA